jgi:hypothetical protein
LVERGEGLIHRAVTGVATRDAIDLGNREGWRVEWRLVGRKRERMGLAQGGGFVSVERGKQSMSRVVNFPDI